MNNPLISVCFLSYNRLEKLHRTIESMRKVLQEGDLIEKTELIVLDNASREDKNIEYINGAVAQGAIDKAFCSTTNLGQGGGLNKLFDMASGDYILSVQDDWVSCVDYPFLLRAIWTLRNFSEIGLVQLKYKVRPDVVEYELTDRVHLIKDNNFGGFSYQIHLTSREVYDKWGPFEVMPEGWNFKNGHDEGSLSEYENGKKYASAGFRAVKILDGQFFHIGETNESKKCGNAR